MTNRRDYGNRAPHFDGENENIINAPEGPQMGIRIDADPNQKQNPNPFHLDINGKKGIKGFSKFFEEEKE